MSKLPEKRLRVAVVGLLPGQEKRVRQAVSRAIDIRFLPAGRRPRSPWGCATVVLMTRFIGHRSYKEALSRFRRQHVSLCRRGTTRLVALLRRLGESPLSPE